MLFRFTVYLYTAAITTKPVKLGLKLEAQFLPKFGKARPTLQELLGKNAFLGGAKEGQLHSFLTVV